MVKRWCANKQQRERYYEQMMMMMMMMITRFVRLLHNKQTYNSSFNSTPLYRPR